MKRAGVLALAFMLLIVMTGCSDYQKVGLERFIAPNSQEDSINAAGALIRLVNEQGETIKERFDLPNGFERVPVADGSYEAYLRSFPLKPHGSPVLYFNGDTKPAEVHEAVLDIDVGNRDLQQCADAAMRLRAEYLYKMGEVEKIQFNFTNGFRADFSKWIQGYSISVKDNKSSWVKSTSANRDYKSFRKYLDVVFAYAGTASLVKEMKQIQPGDMKIGDVFIKGGSPGHCVIIMDMAENKETGERIFLLAQSYMPAQEIHVLKNPKRNEGYPWYTLKEGEALDTPEWDFTAEQLMRFQ